MHGGQALGTPNTEGEEVLVFAIANELISGNSWFKKKSRYLVTFKFKLPLLRLTKFCILKSAQLQKIYDQRERRCVCIEATWRG